MTLDQILQPCNRDRFLAEFWQKKFLYVERSSSGFYDDIVTQRQIEDLLLHPRMRYPEVRLVRNGKNAAKLMMMKAGWLDKIAPVDFRPSNHLPLYEAYNDGYTLVLRGERVCQRLAAFCRELEEWLQQQATAEVFLAPRGSQDSPIQTNIHDIFIMQVAGAKGWRIYNVPHGGPSLPLAERVGSVLFDRTLRPGDLLYVPRLLPHEAIAEPAHSSVHIKVSPSPLLWRDFMLHRIFTAMDADPRFDEPLPAAFLRAPADEMQSTLKELWESVGQYDGTGEALDLLHLEFCHKLPPIADDQFAQLDMLSSLAVDSPLQLRSGMVCHLVRKGDKLRLAFPGSLLELPGAATAAVQAILSATDSFTAASLPGIVDDRGRLGLVRLLFKVGLVRFAAIKGAMPSVSQGLRTEEALPA
jgi:ribosomal protein L16 Arg81 hydroxylase